MVGGTVRYVEPLNKPLQFQRNGSPCTIQSIMTSRSGLFREKMDRHRWKYNIDLLPK